MSPEKKAQSSELFDALRSVDAKKLSDSDKADLLILFNETTNHMIRDQIALLFSEARFEKAVPAILKKAKDINLFNHTGTLVYSLDVFDLRNYFMDLLEIMIHQAYESKATAYMMVERISNTIPISDKNEGINKLKRHKEVLNSLENDEDSLDFIEKALNLLIYA